MPPRHIPADGPSDQALDAFARLIERGLRDRHPGYDFVVRRRETPGEHGMHGRPLPPDDGEPIRRV